MKKNLFGLLFLLIGIFFTNTPDAQAVSHFTGALGSSFERLVPSDGGEHASGTTFGISVSSQLAGNLTFSDTFSTAIEMGPDGTIGKSEDPYIGRSFIPTIGSVTYDLTGIDFSIYSVMNSIGFEFHSHGNLLGGQGGSITLKDGATTLASRVLPTSDQFGPWSFVLPYGEFLTTSRLLTFDLSILPSTGNNGQWHLHGVHLNGTLNPSSHQVIPEPASLTLTGIGLLAATFQRRRKRKD